MDDSQNIKAISTRKKLVDGARVLFYKYGYKKVTVEEICREAGVSKMTFYRFYENKLDLVRFIITEMAESGIRVYREIMDSDLSFQEKIRQTIRMKQESANLYSEEFLKDIYGDKKGEVMPLIQKVSAETMVMVMEDYRIAQEQGHIRHDLNLAFIPYILNKISEMVDDPALLAIYGDMHSILREVTNLFFYGISSISDDQEK